jgi:ubiquinone/menaquinone biosynthesis C-methylase UbiE
MAAMSADRGPTRGFFDAWSRVYDAPLVQRLTYRPVHDAVVAELVARRPRRVLDVGCGTGLLTARLRDAFPAAHVVGVDFSAGMLAQAAARSPGAPWVRADALRLPVASGRVDAIVSTEAFHWFPDQAAALAEMRRVLVPGGAVLVALVNVSNDVVGVAARLASRIAGQPLDWPTRARMRNLFEGAGLRVVAQRWILRFPAPLLLPPVLTVGVRDA